MLVDLVPLALMTAFFFDFLWYQQKSAAPEKGYPLTFRKIFLNNLFCKVVHSTCLVFPVKTITGQAEPVIGQPEPAAYTAVLMIENGQKS